MNTILGVILVIHAGQLDAGIVAGVYPSMDACRKDVTALIEAAGDPPAGFGVASLCADLSDDLAKTLKAPTKPKAARGQTKI